MSSGSEMVRRRERTTGSWPWVPGAALLLALVISGCWGEAGETSRTVEPPAGSLRVCADPNNLPFSNERREGFENAIAELLAADLGRRLEYTWWPQRRGFVRNTLQAGACDLIVGVPAGYDMARTTKPYYRSTYVFATRRQDGLHVTSLDDPMLERVRIGVHVIGDDYANVPPAQALARRSIIRNVRGYSIYGDYSQPNPPAALIAAVAGGEIDVAIAWGPLAGYFAPRQPVALALAPLHPEREGPFAFVFDIAMAVRRDDDDLHAAIEAAIARRRGEIDRLLREFGVPLVEGRGEGRPDIRTDANADGPAHLARQPGTHHIQH